MDSGPYCLTHGSEENCTCKPKCENCENLQKQVDSLLEILHRYFKVTTVKGFMGTEYQKIEPKNIDIKGENKDAKKGRNGRTCNEKRESVGD